MSLERSSASILKKKNEILLLLDKYKYEIDNIRDRINQIQLGKLADIDSQDPYSQKNTFNNGVYKEVFNSCIDQYRAISEYNNKYDGLLRSARFREAKIKTGNVKKKITEQINLLLRLKTELNKKLNTIISSYQTYDGPFSQEQVLELNRLFDLLKTELATNDELTGKLDNIIFNNKKELRFLEHKQLTTATIDQLSREIQNLKNELGELKKENAKLREGVDKEKPHMPFFSSNKTKQKDKGKVQINPQNPQTRKGNY